MSKLIVNQLQPYSGSLITFVDSTNVDIGGTLAVTGTGTFTGGIAGTLSTAAQTNITSVGTLSSLTVSGDLTVDTDTLYVDSANNRVGVGTSSPSAKLDIKGAFHIERSNTTDYSIIDNEGNFNFKAATGGVGGDFNMTFSTSGTERMRIDSSGNVGIGTSPVSFGSGYPTLDIKGSSGSGIKIGISNSDEAYFYTTSTATYLRTASAKPLILGTFDTERMRITSAGNVGIGNVGSNAKLEVTASSGEVFRADASGGAYRIVANQSGVNLNGNVGIGTSSPSVPLEVNIEGPNDVIKFTRSGGLSGALSLDFSSAISNFNSEQGGYTFSFNGSEKIAFPSTGGITFNGDTAAANALDDYEEGTWTMGISFDGASVGVSYDINTGSYTKIGNKVTVTGFLVLLSKGTSTGAARITGLPYTISNTDTDFSAPSFRLDSVSFADFVQAYGLRGSSIIVLEETTNAGLTSALDNTNFTNSSRIIISFTYFTS